MYCVSCPSKGPLKRNFVKCTNCDSHFHESCAVRSGYIAPGVIKKCCKNKILSTSEYNSPDSELVPASFSTLISQDLCVTNMAVNKSGLTIDELWEKIEEKIDTGIGQDIKKIKSDLKELNKSIDIRFKEVDERLSDLETAYASNNEQITESVLIELNSRKARERNVIFCNVPEPVNTDDDSKYIVKLLDAVKDDIDLNNLKFFRLGKVVENQKRPRLLKVIFNNSSQAQWLIFNYKSLKFDSNITCKSDSTPFQRSVLTKAIIDLKNREKAGEKNLTIKYIDNVPRCVSSLPNNSRKSTKTTTKNSNININNFQS